MMHGYGSFWSMMLMIVFWVGLISLGVYLITNYMSGSRKKETPLQILQKRLANGEIDEAEYNRLKSILKEEKKYR